MSYPLSRVAARETVVHKQFKGTRIEVVKDDVTIRDGAQAFVYYAQHDLKLGSGFGAAIAVRGGPSVQKELDGMGPLETGQAVTSGAGELKADHIIHAVGPRFLEPDIPGKLRRTMQSTLEQAEQKAVERLAFPPMGYGFYGVPLDLSARIMVETIKEHLAKGSNLKEVVVCVTDAQHMVPFIKELEALA